MDLAHQKSASIRLTFPLPFSLDVTAVARLKADVLKVANCKSQMVVNEMASNSRQRFDINDESVNGDAVT
jgi:hypothetical protein